MGGCSGALHQEYRELELLDDIVRLRYQSLLPSSVYGDHRNTLIESFRLSQGAAIINLLIYTVLCPGPSVILSFKYQIHLIHGITILLVTAIVQCLQSL